MKGVLSFLTQMPGWARILGGCLGLLIVVLSVRAWNLNQANKLTDKGFKAGVNEAVVQGQEIIIKNMGAANAARETIDRQADAGVGNELHAQCLRSARTPGNCARFLPH